jgi:transaldolase
LKDSTNPLRWRAETMSNKLEQLKAMTTVVADTGDIEAIKRFAPVDATTNPSLLLKAADLPRYRELLERARKWASDLGGSATEQSANCNDRFVVDVGSEILGIIPGRVSTEVDARLSFDTRASIERAKKLIGMYEAAGFGRERILIKLASTWEGICAARQLERDGINCNLTLLFNFDQAAACADAGAFLISPFVGRILDWYKANTDVSIQDGLDDPGVQFVTRVYNYLKKHGYQTVVMGASFRNTGEIEALAGCDRLTISPALMEELEADETPLKQRLCAETASTGDEKASPTEAGLRYALNEDAMATEKLAEGIRKFAADQVKLEQLIGLT